MNKKCVHPIYYRMSMYWMGFQMMKSSENLHPVGHESILESHNSRASINNSGS